MRTLSLSELARFNETSAAERLLAVGGVIYDVSGFLDRHPGGDATIRAFLGRDCTEEFERIHSAARLGRTLARLAFASLWTPRINDPDRSREWSALTTALDESVRLLNVFCLESEVLGKTWFREPSPPRSPFERRLAADLARRVETLYLPHLRVVTRNAGVYALDVASAERLAPSDAPGRRDGDLPDAFLPAARRLLAHNLEAVRRAVRHLEERAQSDEG